MNEAKSVRGWVAGRVQGVNYRASFARQAERLKLTGWVRNEADGRVSFCVHGAAAAVDELLAYAKRGPRFARVEALQVETADEVPPATFEIRH
jgi:acylphosphatase